MTIGDGSVMLGGEGRTMGDPAFVDPWPEDYFRRYLRATRRLCAWCLVRITGTTEDEATGRALQCFPNPRPDEPPPGMLLSVQFNMGALRIAAREIFPDHPGHREPDEFGLRAELDAETKRQYHGAPWHAPLLPSDFIQ